MGPSAAGANGTSRTCHVTDSHTEALARADTPPMGAPFARTHVSWEPVPAPEPLTVPLPLPVSVPMPFARV